MMNMEHRQTQTQTQTQQLVLTQKMQQALQILQMSGLELEQYVQQELEENPFLEQQQKKEEMPEAKQAEANPDDEKAFDESFDLDSYEDAWMVRRKEGQDLSRNEDNFARRDYYESTITKEKTLRAHLLEQLYLSAENDADLLIGERIIIGDIDDRGYFTGQIEEIAEELGKPEDAVRRVLEMIRGFEPTGVGAVSVEDCLLLQIDAEHPGETQLRELAAHHLEALKHHQIPEIARKMKVKPARVEELRKQLSALNPWPGHLFDAVPTQYIAPDVVVEEVEGDYLVRLVDERVPQVRVNKKYHKNVKHELASNEEKDFVRKKMESANWLERNIAQRQETIRKVSQAIVDIQEEFMRKGVEHIRPLTLQDIADVVGVHESTVARTTRGKYIQTPQGLYELKYFFSPGLQRDVGEAQSSKSVQALVKKIIDEEDKRKPLSDQKIADMIKAQGINIARRTVTKYREGLGILKTSMRRQY